MMNRRAFMSSAALMCFGALPRAEDRIRELNNRRIDEATERFAGCVSGTGYLDQPAFEVDYELRLPQEVYAPQVGDLMFSVSQYASYRMAHRLVGAGEPSHSGIIIRRCDGTLAILEAAPFDVALIRSMELISHLVAYHNRSRVWLRTRAIPLTEEQSNTLNQGAALQEGKPFARFRFLGQGTPFRSRGPLRTEWTGQPHGLDRQSYFCSELVTELLVASGLVAASDARPSATYPHELFFDASNNRFLNQHFHLSPCWNPPARWRPQLV